MARTQTRGKYVQEQTTKSIGKALVEQLAAQGFEQIRLEVKSLQPVSAVCGLGIKPTTI
ncbi:hypothetical protein [Rivularia sp. PCC 7116]|uniref:hypothetical protein n=1 Tax=Rivularia sp. PCC 7116 TaxID=373994 RepID=UPI0002D86358|nr:hypothetical protein [Rivularia sp. PCC 7116]